MFVLLREFIQCLHNLNFVYRRLRLVCVHKDDLHSRTGWILTHPNQLLGLHDKNCKVCQLDCLWNSLTTFLCCSVDHGSVYRTIIFKKSLLFNKLSKKLTLHILHLHRLFWTRVALFLFNHGNHRNGKQKTKECSFDFCVFYIFCVLNKNVENTKNKWTKSLHLIYLTK